MRRDEDSTTTRLARVNDSKSTSELERERTIADFGATLGFNFTFVE